MRQGVERNAEQKLQLLLLLLLASVPERRQGRRMLGPAALGLVVVVVAEASGE